MQSKASCAAGAAIQMLRRNAGQGNGSSVISARARNTRKAKPDPTLTPPLLLLTLQSCEAQVQNRKSPAKKQAQESLAEGSHIPRVHRAPGRRSDLMRQSPKSN